MEPPDGIILAGGKSSRFGSDKASALLAGRPMLDWVATALVPACSRVVVVRARGQQLPPVQADITVIDDFVAARGPLAGIVSGLRAVSGEFVFVTSCDAPLLQSGLVTVLASLADGFDVVCPEVEGHQQPLVSVYRVGACLPAFEAALARGEGSILRALTGLRVRDVPESALRTADPGLASFRNANRRDVLEAMELELAANRK